MSRGPSAGSKTRRAQPPQLASWRRLGSALAYSARHRLLRRPFMLELGHRAGWDKQNPLLKAVDAPEASDGGSGLREESVVLAATLVSDCLHGRRINYRRDAASVKRYRIFRHYLFRNAVSVVAVLHMALAIVEPPRAGFGSGLIPFSLAHTIEFAFLLVYVVDFYLHASFLPPRRFRKETWLLVKCGCIAVFVADLFTSLVGVTTVQFSRCIRPLFFVAKRRYIGDIFRAVLRSLPRLTFIAILVLFVVTSFALFGFMAFSTQTTNLYPSLRPANGTEVNVRPMPTVVRAQCAHRLPPRPLAVGRPLFRVRAEWLPGLFSHLLVGSVPDVDAHGADQFSHRHAGGCLGVSHHRSSPRPPMRLTRHLAAVLPRL